MIKQFLEKISLLIFGNKLITDLQPILDALSSNSEPRVIEHALLSLRSLAVNDTSRGVFYMLSSPGYHPRGWKNLLKIVCHFVEIVRAKLEAATYQSKTIQQQQEAKLASSNISRAADLQISNSSSSNSTQQFSPNASSMAGTSKVATPKPQSQAGLFDEKRCFFLPPTLNPRSYEYFGLSKQAPSLLNFFFLPPIVSTVILRFREIFFPPAPLLSTFETKCAIFVIQAVSSVVAHSLKEDRFGVVQKDLRMVITLLTGLSATIDAYVRTSKLGAHNYYDSNVFVLDAALANALKEINEEFRPVLRELNLPPNEQEIFETLTTH